MLYCPSPCLVQGLVPTGGFCDVRIEVLVLRVGCHWRSERRGMREERDGRNEGEERYGRGMGLERNGQERNGEEC